MRPGMVFSSSPVPRLLRNAHDLILARWLLQLLASHPQSVTFKSRKKKRLLITQFSLFFFFFFFFG